MSEKTFDGERETANKPLYRLLACDLDGTLMGDDTTISPGVMRAIAAAQAQGTYVTLATGRGFREALPFARQLDITIPLICYQGGIVKHPESGQVIHQATMDRELMRQIINVAEACDWQIVVYIGDDIYIREHRHSQQFYRDMLGLRIQQVDDLVRVLARSDTEPAKFLVVTEPDKGDRIGEELNHRFGESLEIVRSHDLFVEGNPLGVNKGDALRRLAEHLQVPQGQTMAIGDQGNDVEMLIWAGLGIAMRNGSPAAQAAADWIAPPITEDGAVVAIERFLLK